MITERASGHSASGDARRPAVVASQSMSPCAPSAMKRASRSLVSGVASGRVMPAASKPQARALSISDDFKLVRSLPFSLPPRSGEEGRFASARCGPGWGDFCGVKDPPPAPDPSPPLASLAGGGEKEFSEIQIGVVLRRRQAAQRLGGQWPERRPRLHPRVPLLGCVVVVPRYFAQIIHGGQVRRRSQIGERQVLAGEPVTGARQPTDIG